MEGDSDDMEDGQQYNEKSSQIKLFGANNMMDCLP